MLGNILPLRNHPVRVAEEYAMIDCLSNGRLIAGFVRGIPPEYIWYGVNPDRVVRRFQEAYDLIMTAWTQSVWSFEGEFFKLKDCAIWPRPVQQPHPPIWIAARSAESIEWCVKRHLTCAQVYQTTGQIEDTFGDHPKANEDGWHAAPDKFILCRQFHIDESEQKAREFGDPAMRYFFDVSSIAASTKRSTRARWIRSDGCFNKRTLFQLFPRRQPRAPRFFQARLARPHRQR